MHYMELGGAETSLIGLLDALDPEKVDVDLFIHSHQGPLMQYIPTWVNVLPEKRPYSVIERPITETIKKMQMGVAWGRLRAKLKHRNYIKKIDAPTARDASELQYVADCVESFLPPINPEVEYDLCISYLSPHNYALRKVKARKRIAWIHTDYSTIHINTAQELPVWDGFDHIVSISPEVTETFLATFPSLRPKIIEIENVMPSAMIKSRADEEDVISEMPINNGHNLLSIGRFCNAKNYDNVPEIARWLVEKGLTDLKWYIIGYGGDEALIREKIAESGMENHVVILGKRTNPYPYIKACDIYVQPSRYEGKSITVREAQILGKPVAITNYPTATSQVNHGIDGVIVRLDNEGCAAGLYDFIRNTELQQQLTRNISTIDIAGLSDVNKLYQILS